MSIVHYIFRDCQYSSIFQGGLCALLHVCPTVKTTDGWSEDNTCISADEPCVSEHAFVFFEDDSCFSEDSALFSVEDCCLSADFTLIFSGFVCVENSTFFLVDAAEFDSDVSDVFRNVSCFFGDDTGVTEEVPGLHGDGLVDSFADADGDSYSDKEESSDENFWSFGDWQSVSCRRMSL